MAPVPDPPSLFVSDRPNSDAVEFNFDSLIKTFGEFVASAPAEAPLNICVSGEWGTGKSTLLRGLQQIFERSDSEICNGDIQYVTIWFEPWKLASEEEVRNSLAQAVLEAIEADAKFSVRATIEIERRNVLRVLSDRLLGVNPDEVSTSYKAESRTRDTFVEIEDLFRKLARVYLHDPDQERRLIIFVDDLDRCRPALVTEVLESIKLFFDLPGLLFVFALDQRQIEQAVESEYGYTQTQASAFLEKVFQLTVPLPRKGSTDLRGFLESNLKLVGVELQSENLSNAIVERYGRNLRRLKLFINWFSFQRRLIGEVGGLDEEALFRWLYLDSTMSHSIGAAPPKDLPNMILALEFLAHGGFLYDQDLQARYLSRLEGGEVNYAALISYSLARQDEIDQPMDLDVQQQEVLGAILEDDSIAPTLKVIREGNKLLIDVDLAQMIYLTRNPESEVTEQAPQPEATKPEPGRRRRTLEKGNPLAPDAWNKQGDKALAKSNMAEAYFCYLTAILMEPENPMYICDLAKVHRKSGQHEAVRELYRRAYELNPTSTYALIEIAFYYDITLVDEDMGSLMYRNVLALGTSVSSVPYHLAMNLQKRGELQDAYFAYLDAVIRDPESELKRVRLAKTAGDLGMGERREDRPTDDLEAELDAAIKAGHYPLKLSAEEKAAVAERITQVPNPEQALIELSRPLP